MSELPDDADNIIDLDEYRRRRKDEGTWPPDNDREYWKERRGAGGDHIKKDGPLPRENLSAFLRELGMTQQEWDAGSDLDPITT